MRSPAHSVDNGPLSSGELVQDENMENGQGKPSGCHPDSAIVPPALSDAGIPVEAPRSPVPPSAITGNLASPAKLNVNASLDNRESLQVPQSPRETSIAISANIADTPILPTPPISLSTVPPESSAVKSNLPACDQSGTGSVMNGELLSMNGGTIEDEGRDHVMSAGIGMETSSLSGWLRDSMEYFCSVSAKQSWQDLILCWLAFEQCCPTDGVSCKFNVYCS
jgi:hypothetical protein